MKAISALLGHFCYANSLVCKFWLSSLINYLFAGQAGSPPPRQPRRGGVGMGRGRGGAERASAPSALFSALWALACGETRHARGPSAWGVCRPQPAGRLLTLQVEGGVPSRRPLSLKLSLRPLGMGPMTSTGWAHHGGLPLKDAPRRLEETWGTRGSPPSWCCLSARAASPSPQRESATSRHLTPEPVLAMGPPSHSALHPGGLSPHREARSPGWPEVAPGDLGARGLQFRVGGPGGTPKRPHSSTQISQLAPQPFQVWSLVGQPIGHPGPLSSVTSLGCS